MRRWERCVMVSRVFAVAAGLSAMWSARAAADCETDAECGAGYVCQISEGEKCWRDACPPGVMCPATPTCETYRYGSCVHAPCDADADCPDPMICHAETQQRCSGGGACSRDGNCTMEPPVCETVTTTSCRAPYELPCTVDSDCGGGFRCVEEVYGWCMGSGATPSRDAGTAPSMNPSTPVSDGPIAAPVAPAVDGGASLPPPECGTTRTGRFSCQLLELPCNATSDCPSGLDCVELATPSWDCPPPRPSRDAGVAAVRDAGVATTAPALLPPPGQSGGGVAAPDVDPMVDPVCKPPTSTSIKMCRPPHWYGGPVTTPGTGGPSRGEDGTAEPPKSPGSSNGGGRDAGVGAPTGPSDDGDEAETVDGREERKRKVRAMLRNLFRNHPGCSIAAEGETLDVSWLLVAAGLAVTARRRRRR